MLTITSAPISILWFDTAQHFDNKDEESKAVGDGRLGIETIDLDKELLNVLVDCFRLPLEFGPLPVIK